MTTFFLGTHQPQWVERAGMPPLFLSYNRLRGRRSALAPRTPWALDSGGFTELSIHGMWTTSAEKYAADVQRMMGWGYLVWAAPQDWMCERFLLDKTGLDVQEHQRRTVRSYLELSRLAPNVRWIPVLQGFTVRDYLACAEMYEAEGVSLRDEPTVGVGSVCRRQRTDEAEAVFRALAGYRTHGFGVKLAGLARYGHLLASADSMAWSFDARAGQYRLPGCVGHKNCANCQRYAVAWHNRVTELECVENDPCDIPSGHVGDAGGDPQSVGGAGGDPPPNPPPWWGVPRQRKPRVRPAQCELPFARRTGSGESARLLPGNAAGGDLVGGVRLGDGEVLRGIARWSVPGAR